MGPYRFETQALVWRWRTKLCKLIGWKRQPGHRFLSRWGVVVGLGISSSGENIHVLFQCDSVWNLFGMWDFYPDALYSNLSLSVWQRFGSSQMYCISICSYQLTLGLWLLNMFFITWSGLSSWPRSCAKTQDMTCARKCVSMQSTKHCRCCNSCAHFAWPTIPHCSILPIRDIT